MSDTVIDLSGVERAIKQVASQVESVDSKVDVVSGQVNAVKQDLAMLRDEFQKMVVEQRQTAALEQATTELVTVRQEMEKRFGNYRVVRNSMVGILQATDSALVRKMTISTVSEELMISTPNYWLAPVLVALAAWIGNNRDLADRAIREAVKRDNEHTSLVMALICRRNHRTQTCYEWLARYFSVQDAANFDEDSMVYIDAYLNGIFGPDEKHLCDDYIGHWLEQVRSQSADFDEKQTKTWSEYFTRFTKDEAERFPALHDCAKEFGYIEQYLGRVDAVDDISRHFTKLNTMQVDQEALAGDVDRHLMKLVNSDDPAERGLRAQEEYLLAVMVCQGDIQAARQMVEQRRVAQQQKTMNLVDQLTHAISDREDTSSMSQQKTAVSILRGYINGGFHRYLEENRSAFPTAITISQDGWNGTVTTGEEESALKQSYEAHMNALEQEKVKEAQKKNPKKYQVLAIVCLVVGAFSLIAGLLPLLVLFLIGAVGCFAKHKKELKKQEEEISGIRKAALAAKTAGCQQIENCMSQWKEAKQEAENFSVDQSREIA